MIPIPVISQPPFHPRQLFAALQGAWLEPTQGYIWQENTGVTPTTTGGQTIGLMLDQSQGAVLGPELIVNGDGTTLTGWTTQIGSGSSITSVGGEFYFVSTGNLAIISQNILTSGKYYRITFSYRIISGSAKYSVGGLAEYQITGSGTISTTQLADGATFIINRYAVGQAAEFYIDNISVRQVLGNHAYRSTAANRPILGRRYNLLTYSEDFANAAWVKSATSVQASSEAHPNGGSFTKLVESATTAEHSIYQQIIGQTTAQGKLWVNFIDAKAGERSWLVFRTDQSSAGSFTNASFDLSNGTVGTVGADLSASITSLGNGVYRCAVIVTGTGAGIGSPPYTIWCLGNANNTINYAGDGSSGLYIKNPQTQLGSVATTYQRITTATDYDYGQYPAAVHDTTDSLSVSLPAINVRRNLLTYSEQFDNAAWTKQGGNVSITANYALAPDSTPTADLATFTGTNSLYQTTSFSSSSETRTFSVYVKGTAGQTIGVWLTTSAGNSTSNYALTGDWQRISCSVTPSGNIAVCDSAIRSSGTATSVYIWGAQLELGSVATDYQKVTDWTSEAYSSNGSVYFATPVGMSALHNQSMGTTYTLPALSSDIYSWIVVPQRLNAAQENRLARYMERRASIAGPDIFEQESNSAELVVNGDFSNGKTGWTFNLHDGLVVTGGVATHTSNGVSGNSSYQAIPTRIGRYYSITFTRVTGAGGLVRVGSTFNGFEYVNVSSSVTNVTSSYIVLATTATLYFSFGYGVNGATTSIDNISVYELNDGMTGQLTADDGEQLLLAQ